MHKVIIYVHDTHRERDVLEPATTPTVWLYHSRIRVIISSIPPNLPTMQSL